MQKPESQIVAEGTPAKALLESDFYCAMFKEFTDVALAAIVASQPHETKVREYEYTKIQAMIGFNEHLTGLAVSAQNIINKNTQPSAEDADAFLDGEE